MARRMKRRDFIRTGVQAGITTFVGGEILALDGSLRSGGNSPVRPQIVVVQGEDYFQSTSRALELWGGVGKIISRDSRVAILPNSQSKNPGTFTKPEIVRAAIRMFKEAGAKEVNCLSWLPARFWDATGLGKAVVDEGAQLKIVDMKDDSLFPPVPIPKGKVLKEAKIMKLLSEHDVFVNMPITKDHVGNKFTGTMKNLMGLNSPRLNSFFHTGDDKKPDDIEHLDQCIADLNLACKPALCIVDATEFISTNGPFGPGKIVTPKKVVVGTDRIAIDSYCASLLGLKGEDIVMIKRGFEFGLGEIDLKKVKILEKAA